MKVRFRDLSIQDVQLRAKLSLTFERLMGHGMFILGQEVERFEQLIASYFGFEYAVGVGNGTDSLFLSLIDKGIGAGDEVLVPALSWVATANAVAATGAKPVFIDVLEHDVLLDITSAEVKVSDRTKALIPVHFLGRLCDIDQLEEFGKKHGLAIIEDASQAFGAKFNGSVSHSLSQCVCLSLNPMKVFGGLGEAGVILCRDSEQAERFKQIRNNGINPETRQCETLSTNHKIDALQAALMVDLLEGVDQRLEMRRAMVSSYQRQLEDVVDFLSVRDEYEDSPYCVTILVNERGELMEYLNELGVESQVVHSPILPDHPIYKGSCNEVFPNANRYIQQALSLPLHDNLTENEIEFVCESIRAFLRR